MNDRRAAWNFLLAMLFRDDDVEDLDRVATSHAFWEEALSIANTSLVTAPLWTAIEKRGLSGSILADARDYLEGFHVINGERNAAILGQLRECCDVLREVRVEPMAFKGSGFLVGALYEDIGDRFLTDVDLVVPADGALAAWDALRESGYVLARPATGSAFSGPHQLEPLVKPGAPAELELHVAPVPACYAALLPVEALWAHARRHTSALGTLHLPSATHAFINNVIHTDLIDGHSSRLLLPLRAYFDMHLLLRRHGSDIDTESIETQLSTPAARAALHRMVATLRAITREDELDSVAPELYARVMSRLCREAAVRPLLARTASRYDRLTDRGLRERFGIADAQVPLAGYRLQVIGEMFATGMRRLRRLED